MPKSLNESLAAEPGNPHHASGGGRSMDEAKKVNDRYSKDQKDPLSGNNPKHKPGITFAAQDKLPKLPIPELDHSMSKYLASLRPLQTAREHA